MSGESRHLVEKLAEACNLMGGVEKKGRNDQQKYAYVKAADVAKELRHKLFERGIIVISREVEFSQERLQTNSGGWMTEVTLKTIYTVTDGKENLEYSGYGVARDSGDKAVYKAKTGALKYFLRGLGLIPDEKDDPEADESVDKPENIVAAEGRFMSKTGQTKASPALVSAFAAMFKNSGKTPEQLATILRTRYSAESPSDLTSDELSELVKWAAGKEPIQETLKTSVAAVTEAKERTLDTSVSQSASPQSNASQKGSITEKQIARLFAIAREHGKPEADIRQYVKEGYGLDSLKDLTRLQYDHVCTWAASTL